MKCMAVLGLVVAGCIVGEAGVPGGGGGGGGDGDGSGSGSGSTTAAVDGGLAATCTNAIYDPCTSPTQCASNQCTLFQQSGFQVCTQTCTPGDATTCPMQNGVAAQCNNMGICKPPAANTCTR